MLWMDKYMPEKAEQDGNTDAVFETGNEVGDLARQYFGEYVLVDFDKGLQFMLEETQKYINENAKKYCRSEFQL